jgi:tetratricopeptide (TPR) repeat protein
VDLKADLIAQIESLDAQACSADLPQIQRERAEGELFGLWRGHDEDDEQWTAAAYSRLGSFFRRNDPLLAYEVFAAGLGKTPGSLNLRYQEALTLVRLGAHARSLEIATALSSEKIEDPQLFTDVLGLIARLNKDLALDAASSREKKRYLELALTSYQDAYERSQTGMKSYPAINAATMAMLLGKTAVATKLAKEARKHARAELRHAASSSHWQVATIAEACFVLAEMDEAQQHYEEAVRLAGRRFDDIGSMRRNARTLAAHFKDAGDWVEEVLRIPSVVVFTGHMIDSPDRDRPRFPPGLEQSISAAIETELERLNAGFGFAGAACGSDILFLEAMAKRGHIRIVLPFAAEEFVKTSVATQPRGRWTERFNVLLDHAEQVQVVSGAPSDWGGIVFEYANLLLLGLARLRSRALDTELVGLAVWDKNPGDGPGGTAETVKSWRQHGVKVVEISPLAYLDGNEIDEAS